MNSVFDGQHKHGLKKTQCSFCLKYEEKWDLFVLSKHSDNLLYKTRFIMCSECEKKGVSFCTEKALQLIKTEQER